MGKVIEIRGVRIGEGLPKIIVPIVGRTKEEILEAAASFAGVPYDIVEWRADWFEDLGEEKKVVETLRALRCALGDRPVLFTIRTRGEGGQAAVGPAQYASLNISAARSGFADLLDVELFSGEDVIGRILGEAHAAGVKVVMSSHDFEKTPAEEVILARLRRMQALGADIPKIAVMPQSRRDVLTLLSATERMVTGYADRPVITMSMGGTGLISRLCGESFGSACTFGAVDRTSAPGQMDAGGLHTILQLIHQNCGPAGLA